MCKNISISSIALNAASSPVTIKSWQGAKGHKKEKSSCNFHKSKLTVDKQKKILNKERQKLLFYFQNYFLYLTLLKVKPETDPVFIELIVANAQLVWRVISLSIVNHHHIFFHMLISYIDIRL